MALTHSNMLPLGSSAPAFQLPDTVSGQTKSLSELQSDQGTLVFFICNHCPYVIHILPELKRLAQDYQTKGISLIAISSNDVENYPDDSPEKMKELAQDEGWDFPYLYDKDQSVAKAYDAACTPDFYLFDGEAKLAYRGRLDDSRPNSGTPLTGADLRAALDAVLAKQAVSETQYPSAGCGIKWKK